MMLAEIIISNCRLGQVIGLHSNSYMPAGTGTPQYLSSSSILIINNTFFNLETFDARYYGKLVGLTRPSVTPSWSIEPDFVLPTTLIKFYFLTFRSIPIDATSETQRNSIWNIQSSTSPAKSTLYSSSPNTFIIQNNSFPLYNDFHPQPAGDFFPSIDANVRLAFYNPNYGKGPIVVDKLSVVDTTNTLYLPARLDR